MLQNSLPLDEKTLTAPEKFSQVCLEEKEIRPMTEKWHLCISYVVVVGLLF